MAVHVGTSVITEVTENSRNIIEVSGNPVGKDSLVSQFGRTLGDIVPSTTVNVEFNVGVNHNFEAGEGYITNIFTAPRDGIYYAYSWLMWDNNAKQTNKNYRLLVNGATADTNTCLMYGGNSGAYYKQIPGCGMWDLSEGDTIALVAWNGRFYGASTLISRFIVRYLG